MGKLPPGVCYVLKPPPGYHYEWVNQPPVQVRESSAPVQAAVKAPPKPITTKPKPKPRPRSVLPSQQALGFLRAEVNWLRQQPTETTAVFSLDAAGQVCGCTRIPGTADRCEIDVGHVVRESQGHVAVSVVMLHNHPHRQAAEPSADDDTATEALREALAEVSIGLTDHFICVPSGHVHSYRESAMEPESLWEREQRRESQLWAPYSGRRPF
jgi:DNA repair protein RadC